MVIPYEIIMWGLLFAASGTAFMIGVNIAHNRTERTIADTIDFLIANDYLRHRKLSDGDIELIPFDEK